MPVQFGLVQSSFTFAQRQGDNIFQVAQDIARTAEEVGFDSFWFGDHLIQFESVGPNTVPKLEGWMGIAAIATATRRIRVGTLTTNNLLRYPSLLAKMSATVDVISNGRLIMGIGAGWWEGEHRAYGIPFFPSARERLERLEEALQVLKAMWTQEQATFAGKYYQVRDAICSPKPVQKPHPPILVGGGGEKVTLRLVAQHAVMSNFAFAPVEQVKAKVDALRGHCAQLGRDPREVQVSLFGPVTVGRDQREVEQKVGALPGAAAQQRARQRGPWGTPQQVIETLKGYVDAGVSYFTISLPDADDPEALRAFAKQVMSAFG